MLQVILLLSVLFFVFAYRFYGKFLASRCRSDDSRPTPACTHADGVDYVPTRASIVFGHHFSSIAGAGPIVGPIFAAQYFGWGPTWLWILIGSIFVGGVHDYGSTLMSLRFAGRTVSEITRSLVGKKTAQFFRIFLLLTLMYVIIVFADLTAGTFRTEPAVATASGWFVVAAVIFGWLLRKGMKFGPLLLVFVPLTFAGLAVGNFFPAPVLDKNLWLAVVMVYALVAAVLPVDMLLQPRDFLSSTFLFAMLILGVGGMLLTGASFQIPAFEGFITDKVNPGYIAPMLFITVACGACSGFHSLVASGTTSKQLKRESDAQRVAYGGMLLEGVLAVFALATVAILSGADIEGENPVAIFASGASVFFAHLGIPADLGVEFAALTVSTFLLTTLDTCTRLSRFLLEEFFDWRDQTSRYLGTVLVLIPPAALVFQTFNGQPAWQAIWPMFGSTNQLMAALALVTFVVYLKAKGIRYTFALIPALFMLVMPLLAMGLMALDPAQSGLLRLLSLGMLLLGVFVAAMSLNFVTRGQAELAREDV
ncbi:carbon starvation protein A [Ruficoccus amylovorans]|uniref:Carbon starvation protein A n=1 Tax=Ruficoccus amylovorans TaxID=1804625 RepID=A0A842HFZ2_9BACT|nr:carbon starvation protein A [Ruficoccus amylovorans]MBC2595332.1 carbon starvation protein A [Ruficoccus amylovorans]